VGGVEVLSILPSGEQLETRVAAMAPTEPDILRVLDALRFLERETGKILNVERIETGFRGTPALRRTSNSGLRSVTFFQTICVENGEYVDYCQVMNDRYEEHYSSFTAAVFDFAEFVLPSNPQPGSSPA
jgi:hypothetical protein